MGSHPRNTHGDDRQVPSIRWSSSRHMSKAKRVARKLERGGVKSSQISKQREGLGN